MKKSTMKNCNVLLSALLGLGLHLSSASADGFQQIDTNAVLGGALGGGAGAAVGSAVGGRNGAIVGSAIGAAGGVVIATPQRRQVRSYRGDDDYEYDDRREHQWRHHGHHGHHHHEHED